MDCGGNQPKMLVHRGVYVTSEVLPWVWAPTLEFFGAWLNAHILSGRLLGFITLYSNCIQA